MLGNGTLPALPSGAVLPDPLAGFAFIQGIYCLQIDLSHPLGQRRDSEKQS